MVLWFDGAPTSTPKVISAIGGLLECVGDPSQISV
jgi:hypothetical protein